MLTEIFLTFLLQLTYFAAQTAIVTAAATWLIVVWQRTAKLVGR